MSLLLPTPKESDSKIQLILSEFWKGSRPVYVFGCNVYTEAIVRQFSIVGIVVDNPTQESFFGIPVCTLQEVPKNAVVIVASGGSPFSAIDRVESYGLDTCHYFDLLRHFPNTLKPVVFNESFNEAFIRNSEKFEWLYGCLADEISKNTYQKIINFRRSINLEYLRGFKNLEKNQYFEDFFRFNSVGEVFVDIGCFDGYTSIQFIARCPNYRSVYAFEPDPTNFQICQNNLGPYSNIFLRQFGVGGTREALRFSSAGSASSLSLAGELTIQLERLDILVEEVPTFIKMDIEGGELSALRGAKKLITTHLPRLAICVYHRPDDFWAVPELILGWGCQYDLFLRHYTESIYETVMYFIPKKGQTTSPTP